MYRSLFVIWTLFLLSSRGNEESDFFFSIFGDNVDLGSVGNRTFSAQPKPRVGFFLRSFPQLSLRNDSLQILNPSSKLEWLNGIQLYRLLPGTFPRDMPYHFDGLSSILLFTFQTFQVEGVLSLNVSYFSKSYESSANDHYAKCIFVGVGTGPTKGIKPCLKNPAVNLLPIGGQLWLTIDTLLWGRVDPVTLDTIVAKPNVHTLTLNAHPSYDYTTKETFIQHPCPKDMSPSSTEVCVSLLLPSSDLSSPNLNSVIVSGVNTSSPLFIQHSHSPCLTSSYFVSKLDYFAPRSSDNQNKGMLKHFHQGEGDLWLLMDRSTNSSRILQSNYQFVNNHFWNCYESDSHVVVDTVAATSDYLDSYSDYILADPPTWSDIFKPPQRCLISIENDQIDCHELLKDGTVYFDYPTYNPLWKMRPDYQFFYAIAPLSSSSLWFDRLIKVNEKSGEIVVEWSQPDVYVTEFDFLPNPIQPAEEDDGLLVSILYNQVSDKSYLAVFDAVNLSQLAVLSLPQVVPFHAHGIFCSPGDGAGQRTCYSNP
jgi:carotenoid cleavage dioxygenase-like enzyme